MRSIQMIVAVAENGVIGKDGAMPWRLPSDLAHFKQVTMGCPVVMGRLTWESIGQALSGRQNIVISRRAFEVPDGVELVQSAEQALAVAGDATTVMIIGGGQIYKIFEPMADMIHLTQVHTVPDGDTFFALAQPDMWQEVARQRFSAGEKDSADYSFITLKRGQK